MKLLNPFSKNSRWKMDMLERVRRGTHRLEVLFLPIDAFLDFSPSASGTYRKIGNSDQVITDEVERKKTSVVLPLPGLDGDL
jgi:hypothetical protein